jgi:hypothetical protein
MIFHVQSMLDPWREVGYPEGLHSKEGDPIPWVADDEGKQSWWIEIVVRVNTL